MIRANCRDKFTEEDYSFVVATLANNTGKQIALTELLTEPESRDQILDQPALFESVTEKSSISRVSANLYFYLLTRKSLLQAGIDNRELTDYLASMLSEFSNTKRMHTIAKGHDKNYYYLVDMVLDSLDTSSIEAFFIRSHLGNYALFMTGLFPDHIFRKSTYGRRSPGVDYYENLGRASYRMAAQHRLATQYNLSDILAYLAECFQIIRRALNNLADKHVMLDSGCGNLDKILREIFTGRQTLVIHHAHEPESCTEIAAGESTLLLLLQVQINSDIVGNNNTI